jgi:hypothetical protein
MLLEKQGGKRTKNKKKRIAQPFLNAMCGIVPCSVCPLPLSQPNPAQFLYATRENVPCSKKGRRKEKRRGTGSFWSFPFQVSFITECGSRKHLRVCL